MVKRRIIEIDEDKCDGCELCVSACHEGAIAIVDGKARLVSEVYCDGLGDCLGECPQGAITIVEREAQDFDGEAVQRHLAQRAEPAPATVDLPAVRHAGGCPGTMMRTLTPRSSRVAPEDASSSTLRNWPVQLHLVPVQAPYFNGATLLLAADCVPFAHSDFHRTLLAGRTLLIGCPKLDDRSAYLEKLTAIFRFNDLSAVEVAFMEVPCCRGLVQLAMQAAEGCDKSIPIRLIQVGIDGHLEPQAQRASA